ncbi:10404_t:CDS:2 [Entrophospora sp. SA101]|nr:10404_t:CDS:2 [Entrophospora sp. SA101]
MPRPTKSKSSYKNQIRNPDGTFYSRKLNKGKEIDYFSESTLGNVAELDNDNFLGEVLENEVELDGPTSTTISSGRAMLM